MPLIPIALALAQFVPDIVRWVTGSDNAEAIAEKVVDIAKNVTGATNGDEALKAIEADPSLAMQFQMAVMANRMELEKLYVEDVQNARSRDIEFIKAGRSNTRANVMLAMAFVTLVTVSGLLLFGPVDGDSAIGGALIGLLGLLMGEISKAFNFEFGTSRGSQIKTDNNDRLIRTLAVRVRP